MGALISLAGWFVDRWFGSKPAAPAGVVELRRLPVPNVAEVAGAATYKVVLLGDSNVGKSALLMRHTTGRFDERVEATPPGIDVSRSEHTVPRADGRGERTVALQIWDTGGSERFRSLTRSFLRGAHAVILAFRVDEPHTLVDACDIWFRALEDEFGDALPLVVLVGTCEDLRRRPGGAFRHATHTDIATCLEAVHASEYIPTSAKEGYNVHTVFQNVAMRCALAAPAPAPAAEVDVVVAAGGAGGVPVPPAPRRVPFNYEDVAL